MRSALWEDNPNNLSQEEIELSQKELDNLSHFISSETSRKRCEGARDYAHCFGGLDAYDLHLVDAAIKERFGKVLTSPDF